MRVAGFPLPFYFGAQGAILVYVALIVVYIVLMQFADARLSRAADAERSRRPMKLTNRLIVYYALYTLGFLLFIFLMERIERVTGPGTWIGYVFLFVPIAVYAVIGLLSRTSDLVEYYVAGRRVPSAFNGMATAADWLSAASFIGLAGSIYASGYDGLAYVMGWTGGYCLVAFLLAPYVRKLARYTIPDFLGTRFSSNLVRGARRASRRSSVRSCISSRRSRASG